MSRRCQPLNPRHAATISGHAHCMRQGPSASGQALWAALSGSKLGVGFRRQFVVGHFIADFAAPARRHIVEVDGGYHSGRTCADEARDAKLTRLGWRVLRLSAQEVLTNLPRVVGAIQAALNGL